jgi:flagellar protein FlgJ
MNPEEVLSRTYTSFNELHKLRTAAKDLDPEATKAVAKQFEAMFLQMMLQTMRDASFSDGGLSSDQERFYRDLFDKQIALELAEKQQLGIADLLLQHLNPDAASADEPTAAADPEQSLVRQFNPFSSQFPRIPDRLPRTSASVPADIREAQKSAGPAAAKRSAKFDSPESFVMAVAPHAQRAAEELGVKPEVLIAQAALETGWGAHVIRHRNGNSSNNLFGIKADARWNGARVAVPSLEYEGGVARKRLSAFRSYESIADSFDDYVAFIKGNDRYHHALAKVDDSKAFVRELQRAGYATDPAYARKIIDIMDRNVMGVTTLAALEP